MAQENGQQPVTLFYSYASEDESYRKKLETHLAGLRRQGTIEDWHFRKIGAGKEWENAIDQHLERSRIILLLVSPDFIASDYCYNVEMTRAMEKHERGEARVIPIILRPTGNWKETPFGKLQAWPSGGKPVTKWGNRDEAWVDVVKAIGAAAQEMRTDSTQASGAELSQKDIRTQLQPAAPSGSQRGIYAELTVIPGHCNFSDVLPTHDFRVAVQDLCSRGIISGYADGTFRPETAMTRGQVAKVVSNAAAFHEEATGQLFEDVPLSSAFHIFVTRLAHRDLVQGYPCDTNNNEPCVPPGNRPYFRPHSSITREQLCEFIVRVGEWDTNMEGAPHFSDVPIGHPLLRYVETAYNNHLISAQADGKFGLGTPATRAEVCIAVYEGIIRRAKTPIKKTPIN